MIESAEARELCSKSEWKLVESSFSPVVETLPPSDLKSRIDRAGRLRRKTTGLVMRQHSESRKIATRRKTELFEEAIGRFEATLNLLEKAHSVEPALTILDKKATEATRALNMEGLQERADREMEKRKTHVLTAMNSALRGEQQGQRSGVKRIQSHAGSVTRRQQARRDTKGG